MANTEEKATEKVIYYEVDDVLFHGLCFGLFFLYLTEIH